MLKTKPLLFVVEVPDNMLGGMARHFRFLGEEIKKQGHRVDYIFLEQMPKPLSHRLQGFTLDVCRRACQAVLRYLRSAGDPLLIYWSVNSAFPFALGRRLCKRTSSIPVVGMTFGVEERWWSAVRSDTKVNGGPHIPLYQHLTTGGLRMKVLRSAMTHCDHVVCVSSQDRNYLLANHRIASDRVSMIPVGVARDFFIDESPQRTGRGLLFVGTWIWRKGVKYLVQAMERVWHEEPDCSLSIVGTFQSPELILSDWPPQFRKNIRVLPQATGNDLVREFVTHDIFVLPSLFEGMPLSLAEAMAARMAVITTATCGMLDLIRHDENGLLVPLRDADSLAAAILGLLRNPDRQRQLGERAREAICQQTWDKIARRFLDVFEHCSIGQ